MAYKRKNSEYRKLRKDHSGFYHSWASMKSRCKLKTDPNYPNYGGRGIKVCEEWNDFENFYKDMFKLWLEHSKSNKSTTLDRIDVNGNYTLENCRWATLSEQANNRRHHRLVTWNGRTLNLVQWSKELGIKSSTLRQRFYVYKWDVNKCFTYNTQ